MAVSVKSSSHQKGWE